VVARLSGFGITRAVYASNPSTKVDPTQEIGLAAKHRMRSLRRVDLKELAEESDFLVILAPGGAGTHHVVDEAFLRRMKKTAVLVNAARGTLVDSDALAKALAEGWIYAAGLDVVEGEPNVGLGHPLLKEPRCVTRLEAGRRSDIEAGVLFCRTSAARRPRPASE
jgi:glyoxylate/hydroxypyruvate reductase